MAEEKPYAIIDAVALFVNSLKDKRPGQLGYYLGQGLCVWVQEIMEGDPSWGSLSDEQRLDKLTHHLVSELQRLAFNEVGMEHGNHFSSLWGRKDDMQAILNACLRQRIY